MKERETFGSRLGFILVSAGCAVGLGNVWKFPYMTGKYGGAAFILIYLVFLVLLGLPILVSEFAVGRSSRLSTARAFHKLEPEGSNFHKYSYMGMIGNYMLMMFYTMVAGWMLYYAFLYGSGKITAVSAEETSGFFSRMLDNPGLMILFAAIVIALCIGICALGLQNGIEKITKVMMMLLIVLMLVLVVNSLRLKGAGEGLKYFLVPSFSRLKENGYGSVAFAAMTHAFFTLSVGIGAMEIFGSYLKKGRRITGEAINVVVLDTCVAIMAGLIIIPACFAYGVQPDAGPSLLFITLPNVFHHMVGGRIWGCCFFVFMSFAALSTVIAVFENIITMTVELGSWTRKKSLLVNLVLIFVLSLPAILGFNLLSGFQPFGDGSSVMDLEDFLVSYNILPLGSLVYVLFCVRKNGWGWEKFLAEVNEGTGLKLPGWLRGYMAYVVPTLICLIYLKGYYDMFAGKGTGTLIGWMAFAVLLLAVIFWVCFSVGKKPAAKAETKSK